jgi:hypothetical protein
MLLCFYKFVRIGGVMPDSDTPQEFAARTVAGKIYGFLGIPDLIGIYFFGWFCIECARQACGNNRDDLRAAESGIRPFPKFEDLQDHFANTHGIDWLKMERGGYRHIFKLTKVDIRTALRPHDKL